MRKNQILNLLLQNTKMSALEISKSMDIGLRTIQRDLSNLIENKYITSTQNAKNTVYHISSFGRIICELETNFFSDDRLEQFEIQHFNSELFEALLEYNIFDRLEIQRLELAKNKFLDKKTQTTKQIWQKEIQRLVVEFSWKSSKIEGNTYTLLETEELLNNSLYPESPHTELETNMIINHKLALEYIFANPYYWQNITLAKILEIHKLLTSNLNIKNQFRSHGVGITASLYKPLDNQHQIKEKMEQFCNKLVSKNPFEQAILVSLLVSYIQPFEDGNKRTSRTTTNAILFAHNLPLVSYRSTTVKEYKEAILSFYEFGSIILFKKIFIEQIEYFAENYL
jgi:Fic family protein